MAIDFQARMKDHFNTPDVIRRIGQWRNDILARVGAYGQGVFRNKLSRPQLKQTKERTVHVDAQLPSSKTGKTWHFQDTLFVPRQGLIVSMSTGKPAPRAAALIALQIVSARLKGQGAGKPPRMGPAKLLKRQNDFGLDPKTESVVIGTVPLPNGHPVNAASVPQMLNEGLSGMIHNSLLPGGSATANYAEFPYVQSVMEPTKNKLLQLIQQNPIG